jgi:hypothetical protein
MLALKRGWAYEDYPERLSGYKRRVPIDRYLVNKRQCETEELTKRLRLTDLVAATATATAHVIDEEVPYLVISEMPITKAERSPECFYFMFREWGVDIRIWAATDIQRIYKGWLVRRRKRHGCHCGPADDRLNVIMPPVGLHPGTFIK